MKCGCCGNRYWGVNQQKGHVPGRKKVVTPYYICAGRTKHGAAVCSHPLHLRSTLLERWVLGRLKELIFADATGVTEAVNRFMDKVLESRPELEEIRRIQNDLDGIDGKVHALVKGVDPANVSLINGELTRLRKRRDHLQRSLLSAQSAQQELDEPALRRWAQTRFELLDAALNGTRDDQTRQVMASYIDEIVIHPADKTGTLVVNGEWCADSAGRKKGTTLSQREQGRMVGIAGAGFEPATSGL